MQLHTFIILHSMYIALIILGWSQAEMLESVPRTGVIATSVASGATEGSVLFSKATGRLLKIQGGNDDDSNDDKDDDDESDDDNDSNDDSDDDNDDSSC
ncbi:unnamed protein product [Phytophthora fragariaefolia]|uniref:Unnamed protein product n=1 Tax=Phytophthora fragariaefolia TaxID=1490495 RepID=A0A9W6YMR6_9STRA|nr:unnamed protein product [Phytophthora fragariaefolia]GMF81065.1 unnamed protein product [Phytophthora fragariaefolia]